MIGGSAKNPLARTIASRLDDPLVMDGSVLFHGALGPVHQSGAQSFSCTSVRYVPDFEGLLREVPADVLACPGARLVVNEINPGAAWAGAPYTRDIALAPNGSLTAATVVLFASGSTSQVYQTFDPGSAGRTLTQSVWIRLAVGTAAPINLGFYDGTQGYLMQVTVTDKWQRFSYTATMANYSVSTQAWKIKNDLSGSEQTINVWHPQCEDVTGQTNQNPSEFVTGSLWFDYENGNTVDANGVVTEARGADIPESVLQGVLDELSSTNKCTNYNAAASALTNVTKSGDALGTLTLVDDSTALAAAGLDRVCSTGQVFKLDNSAGSTDCLATISGATGNLNTHTCSAWVRSTGGSGTSIGLTGSPHLISATSAYQRFAAAQTPAATSDSMVVTAAAGVVVYFILNQCEENTYATSPIVTSGATATRTATQRTLQTAGNIRENDWWALLAFTAQHDSADTSPPWEVLLGIADGASGDRANVYIGGDTRITAQRTVSGTSVASAINAVDLSWVQGDVVVVAAQWSSTQGLTIFGTNATTGQGPVSATNSSATALADNIVSSALGFGAPSATAANGAVAIRNVETRFGDAPDSVILAAIEQIAARLV